MANQTQTPDNTSGAAGHRETRRAEPADVKHEPERKAPLSDLAGKFREQTVLVNQGERVKELLWSLEASFRELFADPEFVALLHAEKLDRVPEQLLSRSELLKECL